MCGAIDIGCETCELGDAKKFENLEEIILPAKRFHRRGAVSVQSIPIA